MMRRVQFLLVGLLFISTGVNAEDLGHSPAALEGALRPTATDSNLPDLTDYVKKARWLDESFQYGDESGEWHTPSHVLRATKDGEFINASGNRVSFSKGDILFRTSNFGWFKARPDTKNVRGEITEETVPNPDEVKLSETEKWIIHYTNVYRISLGLKPLIVRQATMNTSRQKSINMANQGNMSHSVPPMPAFQNTMGENIAAGQASAKAAVDAWIHSEGHRQNMINPKFLNIGVGESRRYWTQQFTG